MSDYENRLQIPIFPWENIGLFDQYNQLVISGYKRIVIGGRGPYIEFPLKQLVIDYYTPPDQRWRSAYKLAYYIEYRTIESNLKIYKQKRLVDYADYQIGLCYISPFGLFVENGLPAIIPKQ